MSRWFRHYAGMVRDDKLVRASIESRQSIERVVWIYGAVLESAAELDDGGRYEVDPREIAYFLRCKANAVEAVLEALKGLSRLTDTHVSAWDRRQFKSDRSNARVAAFRDKKRTSGNGDVTLQDGERVTLHETLPKRDGNAPETETEKEVPLDKSNGAAPNSDKQFWDAAKAYLGPKNASMIGAWVRDYGKSETARAITGAQLERAVDPIPYIQGALRKANGSSQPTVPL